MGWITSCAIAVLAIQVITADRVLCPSSPNCVCGGTLAVELNCTIDGHNVEINYLPNTYINIKCKNTVVDYSKLPKCANRTNTFQSVSFKDCPLPNTSFKDVLDNIGVSKTMAIIFQNAKNLSGSFDRQHFAGLQNLTKLLLSVNGIKHLPDNLFADISKLTWLNIRSNSINLSEELFKPLERLETLEISHNHMTNISSNLFSHLSLLRKLSLWQSNVTWFEKDFFSGVDVLEELDLSSNGLNELPPSIFKPLKKLKKLTLFSNKFSSLPQNLFKSNDELETVIILNNDVELRELPKNLFGSLANLKQIYIQRCGLKQIPYDVFANSAQITNISLAYNEISELPESIFNDQIYLLELDLSHNNLRTLKPKLFSSLVRLEKLDLSYNSLVIISGSTFSPLLSLLDLNMEHNKLEFVSPHFFSNNRQRMSISLAYNELDFKSTRLENGTWTVNSISPFADTYNLKLLNLSHNKFSNTFKDWWINGHDVLDISFNTLYYLWDFETSKDPSSNINNYREELRKPLKEVWISNNSLRCSCLNKKFIDFLNDDMKTQVINEPGLDCPCWKGAICTTNIYVKVALVLMCGTMLSFLYLLHMALRRHFMESFKGGNNSPSVKKICINMKQNIVVECVIEDEKFVISEIMPTMVHYLGAVVNLHILKEREPTEIHEIKYNDYTRFVIVTRNYVIKLCNDADVTTLCKEMRNAKASLYIFIDEGPKSLKHQLLKENCSPGIMVEWVDGQLWNMLMSMLGKYQKFTAAYLDTIVKVAAKEAKKGVAAPEVLGVPSDETCRCEATQAVTTSCKCQKLDFASPDAKS